MLKKVSSWAARKAKEQFVSADDVEPIYRWNDGDQSYYLNCCAGLIKYRPKTQAARISFRDAFINRFESIRQGGDHEQFFGLYADIRKAHSVSYRANVRTRLKGRSCALRRLL